MVVLLKIYGVLLTVVFLFQNTVSAQDANLQSRMLTEKGHSAEQWLFLDEGSRVYAVGDQTIQTPKPINIEKRDLVQTSGDGTLIVRSNVSQDRITYHLHDADGQLVHTLPFPWQRDLPLPALAIASATKQIYMADVFGTVRCMSFDGTLAWEKEVSKPQTFTYENTYFMHMDDERQRLYMAYAGPAEEGDPAIETSLYCLNTGGELLFSEHLSNQKILKFKWFESAGKGVACLAPSPFHAAGVGPQTRIINEKLKTVWSGAYLLRDAALEGDQLLLAQKQTVFYINIKSGRVEWQEEIKEAKRLVAAVKMTDGYTLTVSGIPNYENGRLVYQNPIIRIRNGDNETLIVENEPARQYLPESVHYPAPDRFFIGYRDGLVQYEIQQ